MGLSIGAALSAEVKSVFDTGNSTTVTEKGVRRPSEQKEMENAGGKDRG